MFKFLRSMGKATGKTKPGSGASAFALEGLEEREFLSVTPATVRVARVASTARTATVVSLKHTTTTTRIGRTSSTGTSGTSGQDKNETTILFSAAPTAVQTGLQKLAGSTTISASQVVDVMTDPSGNTIYGVVLKSTGTELRLTVDSSGNAVTPPQGGRGDRGDHGGHGPGDNSNDVQFSAAPTAVQTGLQALAGSTTLSATQVVHVMTDPSGVKTYSVMLSGSGYVTRLTVDASGNAVTQTAPPADDRGHGQDNSTTVQFSAAPTAVQTGLQTLAGSTTIATTQTVSVRTNRDGTKVYSVELSSAGVDTQYFVDASGNAVTPPAPGGPCR